MGQSFNALGRKEKAAVAAFVEAEYDRLLFQRPESSIAKNAQADPEGWKERLRELIAADPKRVRAITEKA